MGVQTEQVFFLVCDHCEERLTCDDHGGYLVDSTEQGLREAAESQDWREQGGRWECFDCFEQPETAKGGEGA